MDSPSSAIPRTLALPVPRQKAWDAIATAQGLSGWFSDKTEIDMKIGGKMMLTWDQDGTDGDINNSRVNGSGLQKLMLPVVAAIMKKEDGDHLQMLKQAIEADM